MPCTRAGIHAAALFGTVVLLPLVLTNCGDPAAPAPAATLFVIERGANPWGGGGTNDDLYLMDAHGAVVRQLTSDTAEDFQPSWSPDGSRIAFASDSSGTYQLYTVAADGSDVRRVITDLTNGYEPVWSPDGSRIAFDIQAASGLSLAVANADGSDAGILVSTGTNENPAWSPDGQWIVYASDTSGDFEIYKVHPDGTGVRRLTSRSGAD